MRFNTFKSFLIKSGLAASVLLLGGGVAVAQVNLTAAPINSTLPDGSIVPMWGYSCGALVTGATATCAASNPAVVTAAANATTAAVMSGWSPVVITVPYVSTGTSLTINLTNGLPAAVAETSLVIVGQLGGGLGSTATSTPSPTHATQGVTWPIVISTTTNTPPPQGDRVQSFSTPATHTAPASLTWSSLKPGTYLIESGTHPSIQGPMGLYGVLVVTAAPGTTAGCAYPGATATAACAVPYNAEVPLLLSEIDPVQNAAVNTAVNTSGFSEVKVWSGLPGACGNPNSLVGVVNTCYPPAVNYTPLYYLINGVAFNKAFVAPAITPTALNPSLFAATAGTSTGTVAGTVLVRFVNAGLRMHVPSIVGAITTPAIVPTGAPAATAVPGFSLVAEDGNPLPGVSRVQSEVFLAAGKTYDVMVNVPAAGGTALPVFDRELSLSGNATARDAGMLAYIGVNGAGLPAAGAFTAAVAVADTYNSVVPGNTLIVSDPSKGLIANDTNVYGVQLIGTVLGLKLNANGTFTYLGAPTNFMYCANGSVTAGVCSSGITATVTLGLAPIEAASGITCPASAFSSTTATTLSIKPPGILAGCKDAAGYPLTVNAASVVPGAGLTLSVDPNGGFNASTAPCIVATGCPSTFSFKAQNSQNTVSAATATVTVTFAAGTGVNVALIDGATKNILTGGQFNTGDYRWIIEEDRTFYINPACTTNPPPAGCPGAPTTATPGGIVPTFGTNFHTSYMPVVAAGCTGPLSCEAGQSIGNVPVVCDGGNGVCRTTAGNQTPQNPNTVHLDPTKHYYISVLPGDAANSFENLNGCLSHATADCGHGMGGAPIACAPAAGTVACTATTTAAAATGAFPTSVNVFVQPNPFPPSKLSVFVFEDDFPLNGEHDGGGGIDVLSPNESGLSGFNITLFDDAGGPGDATGQMTYDMFNMPLSNGLAGTVDPATGLDACPVSGANQNLGFDGTTVSPTGITGTIVTCPKYEADGKTLSPLAGQAVVSNLMPGRYGVVATPGADRIARGEEWLQTNTLDGQKAHDSFLRVGEPSFFQEYGPAGYHVTIGFANPAIINARKAFICNGTDANSPTPGVALTCNNSVMGTVTTSRMSRTPDERLYSSGDNSSFAFTQCYVSLGDPDGEDFAFTKCDSKGNFTLSGLPPGDWRVTVFDQWNDMLVDGLSTPVRLAAGATANLGQIATNQWQANIYTTTFLDLNSNGTQDGNEPGLTLVATNNRFRDGSYSNQNNTDLSGNAGFNEIFPLFSWYVIETDSTRFKNTGAHVVYDAGGPADGSTCGGTTGTVCGSSTIANRLANSAEQIPVPMVLRVPGAYYCATADCTDAATPFASGGTGGSTGRIDPAWVTSEGWQGFSGQNSFIQFGKKPYVPGETGGIHGEVIYASTRPFDDPSLLIHTTWTPDVPNVTINLYKEGTAPDGSVSLTLIDTTKTSSFDDWAQGFRSDGNPNMNCPGQGTATGTNADLFFYSLYNQPDWLDQYNNGGTPAHTLPANSQYKCYDGMHNWNQVQPAPYDGMYYFPSVTGLNPSTGKPSGTNCTACVTNPDATDPYRYGGSATSAPYVSGTSSGAPMLPAGTYVVEMAVPPGYELVKEEDKNILIGDNFIAPVTQQFAGLGNIFILPDQAEVSAYYNANNPQNSTNALGRTTLPSHEGDTGSVEEFWPCVGATRTVPDFMSLFPQSKEVAPFAGATRNLCDRKEVTVKDQMAALAKFWIFSSTHVAAHFTGVITDDFTSEFDPFSPQFGEKFSPPDMPISIKDWSGTEIARTYSDHWGAYNGLTYSTWEVNPPNPTGYAPTMMVTCMNDPGTGLTPDPLFNPQYSQFCYEIPFMPGQTQYMDTPVVPTSAFAGAGYNNPDCAYPALTPAIAEVDGFGIGPWVNTTGSRVLTIRALGDQMVPNNAYSGPAATAPPYNQKKVLRHYGFGGTAGTVALVGSDGGVLPLTGVSWSDTVITGTVPAISASFSSTCPIQQQSQYAGTVTGPARCGQLVITTSTGQQSIDTITVTSGGKTPTHVAASGSIQAAIDAAKPGDLIIIDPTCATTAAPTSPVACTSTTTVRSQAAHQEIVLMWKPVRLQGVGAASSVINANTHPAGATKVTNWRQRVDCLFGLGPDGSPNTWDVSCGTGGLFGSSTFGFTATKTTSGVISPQVDRLPLEATVGWDAGLNGNLAELLQEPSLMGALEGAGITVLSKGVDFHGSDPFDPTLLAGFPANTTLLTTGSCGSGTTFPSSFQCNPSSIDGLSITNSSQGGGGVFVHGWGHNLQIANNRIYNNAGTLSGGINVGQGEFPPSYLAGGAANAPPGSCKNSDTTNLQLPYCHNLNVNVHHNAVTSNSSTGDELFSATPAGAGGVSFCTGSDYYKFNYNWVCGNLSSGDGGGVAQMGFSYGGDIEHNQILFNQSTNPTIATNGGGLLIMGTPDVDPTCGATTDADCVPTLGSVGPSDGVGPGLVINANLIMGNSAESGSGGGLRLQHINGSDVISFPNGGNSVTFPGVSGSRSPWYDLLVTNNIIVDNVAGWDGAGVSLLDALNVNIINNTIVANDSTASAGPLFDTIGAPLASTQQSSCVQTGSTTASCPQIAGLVSIQNSATLVANFPTNTTANPITCPANHGAGGTGTGGRTNGACRRASVPELYNDVFWQNRSFYIGVGALGAGTLNQQHVVALRNAVSGTAAASQATTGACVSGSSYWDIGVRGDTGPTNHNSTVTLDPKASILTIIAGYPGGGTGFRINSAADPTVVSQYCDGSRIPPEFGGTGWQVPPGIADATVPNPVFNLQPAATVDEGNNWVNISWGPLAETNPVTGVTLGNYALAGGSPAINYITPALSATTYTAAPSLDFFNNARKTNNAVDVGAVEFQAPPAAILSVAPSPLEFGNVPVTTTSTLNLTVSNTGTLGATGIALGTFPAGFARATGAAAGTCGASPFTLAVASTCTVAVTFTPTAVQSYTGPLPITASVPVTGAPVTLSGAGVAAVRTASLAPATWAVTRTRNCPGTGFIGILACSLDPIQMFTLTNTGNVPLTSIGQGALTVTAGSAGNFAVVRLLSTCGPSVPGQLMGLTTLAPGAACVVTVQFKPLFADTASPPAKTARISVTDVAGTQTSAITGTAN